MGTLIEVNLGWLFAVKFICTLSLLLLITKSLFLKVILLHTERMQLQEE